MPKSQVDSERTLLDKLSNEVKNVDDVDKVKKEFVKKWLNHRVPILISTF